MPSYTQPPYLLEDVRVEYCHRTAPDPGILACEAPAVYRPRHAEATVFYQTFEQHFEKYVAAYEERFEPRSGPLRHVCRRRSCSSSRAAGSREVLPAFVALRARANTWSRSSCRTRNFCGSCQAKRAALFAEKLATDILPPV